MKDLRIMKAGFVGIIAIMISTSTYGKEIETKYKQNLEEAKKTNGTELFEDGEIKLKINTEMLDRFYNTDYEEDEFSWRDLLSNSDSKSFADLLSTYRATNEDGKSFAEIRKDLEKKYNEVAEISNKENELHENMLSEKNQETKLITQVID